MCPVQLIATWNMHSVRQYPGYPVFVIFRPYEVSFCFHAYNHQPTPLVARILKDTKHRFCDVRFRESIFFVFIMDILHLVAETTVDQGLRDRRSWNWFNGLWIIVESAGSYEKSSAQFAEIENLVLWTQF